MEAAKLKLKRLMRDKFSTAITEYEHIKKEIAYLFRKFVKLNVLVLLSDERILRIPLEEQLTPSSESKLGPQGIQLFSPTRSLDVFSIVLRGHFRHSLPWKERALIIDV